MATPWPACTRVPCAVPTVAGPAAAAAHSGRQRGQAVTPVLAPAAAARGGAGQRRRQPLPSPPPAASAAHGGGASSAGGYESDTDGRTAEQRLALVKNMIATAELLVPYDRSAVNLGLILWGAIRNIPPKDRTQLLTLLNSGDIKRLWKAAGQRYTAPKQHVAAAIGPDYSVWRDMPAEDGQLAMFRGKAALPTHVLGVSSFEKAFFLRPAAPAPGGAGRSSSSGSSSSDGDSRTGEEEALHGRVLLGKGPLGDLLYPLYFKADVGPSVVPTTQELCDVTLRYLPPEQMGLAREDLPRSAWPSPRTQLPPFHDGFTDYLRAVAPGVYVGLGYRTASTEVNEPLYFMMVLHRMDSLH